MPVSDSNLRRFSSVVALDVTRTGIADKHVRFVFEFPIISII